LFECPDVNTFSPISLRNTYKIIGNSFIVIFLCKEEGTENDETFSSFSSVYFVIIKPDLSQTNSVLLHHVNITRPLVWRAFSKNVPNMGARRTEKFTTTLPNLNGVRSLLIEVCKTILTRYFEGELEIFTTPNVHAWIVHSELFEPITIDGE
jgi:hypothetical protein